MNSICISDVSETSTTLHRGLQIKKINDELLLNVRRICSTYFTQTSIA